MPSPNPSSAVARILPPPWWGLSRLGKPAQGGLPSPTDSSTARTTWGLASRAHRPGAAWDMTSTSASPRGRRLWPSGGDRAVPHHGQIALFTRLGMHLPAAGSRRMDVERAETSPSRPTRSGVGSMPPPFSTWSIVPRTRLPTAPRPRPRNPTCRVGQGLRRLAPPGDADQLGRRRGGARAAPPGPRRCEIRIKAAKDSGLERMLRQLLGQRRVDGAGAGGLCPAGVAESAPPRRHPGPGRAQDPALRLLHVGVRVLHRGRQVVLRLSRNWSGPATWQAPTAGWPP